MNRNFTYIGIMLRNAMLTPRVKPLYRFCLFVTATVKQISLQPM